jgi:flagellum-specific peptidoglycan hydrolase FlgJ
MKTFSILLFALLMLSSVASAQIPSKYKAFFEENKAQAQMLSKDSGVPVSVMFAVAVWESQCGASSFAQRSNNIFSIQCSGSWAGDCEDLPEGFYKIYISTRESLWDFAWLLHDRNPDSINRGWRYFVQNAAYYGGASRDEYWTLIEQTIKSYQLYLYDIE